MEIKWIRLQADLFDNKKIKYIRSRPAGDLLCLIWIMLLALAGKCNDNGFIYVSKYVSYTDETLANELNVPLQTLRLAVDTFVKLNMIVMDEKNYIRIVGLEDFRGNQQEMMQ